jgi:hypothetical protein
MMHDVLLAELKIYSGSINHYSISMVKNKPLKSQKENAAFLPTLRCCQNKLLYSKRSEPLL